MNRPPVRTGGSPPSRAGAPAGRPPLPAWAIAAGVLAIALFAALCGLAVDGACTEPGPPVSLPEPGTSRAGYCDALFSVSGWGVLVGAPAAAAAATGWAFRHRPRAWCAAGAVVAAAALVNACVAQSLPFAYTI